MPGVGKTSCVVEYSYRIRENKIFDKVHEFSSHIEPTEENKLIIFNRFYEYMIIFDNVENITNLKNIIRLDLLSVPFIITTRLKIMR